MAALVRTCFWAIVAALIAGALVVTFWLAAALPRAALDIAGAEVAMAELARA